MKPEAALERAVAQYLALDGWRAIKTDPVSRREWGKGFGEKGMADFFFLRFQCDRCRNEDCENCLPAKCDLPGPWRAWTQVLMIEFKAPRGRLKPHQRTWHAAERARGALTLIAGQDFAPTLEGFDFWYAHSGLRRRKLKLEKTPPPLSSDIGRRFKLATADRTIQRR